MGDVVWIIPETSPGRPPGVTSSSSGAVRRCTSAAATTCTHSRSSGRSWSTPSRDGRRDRRPGAGDRRGGVAFVVLARQIARPPPTSCAAVSGSLADYKVPPRRARGDLPRNAMSKIDKRELRAHAEPILAARGPDRRRPASGPHDTDATSSPAEPCRPPYAAAVDVVEGDRHLVGDQVLPAQRNELRVGGRPDPHIDDEGNRDLTEAFIGDTDHSRVGNRGGELSTSSTCSGKTLLPPRLMTSPARPSIQTKPSGSTRARSPVRR